MSKISMICSKFFDNFEDFQTMKSVSIMTKKFNLRNWPVWEENRRFFIFSSVIFLRAEVPHKNHAK